MLTAPLIRLLGVCASTVAFNLALAPHDLHALQWVLYVPTFLALRPGDRRGNLLLALAWGVVAHVDGFHWLTQTITLFSNIPAIGAVGILILFSVGFGVPYLVLWPVVPRMRERLGLLWVAVFPAWWVLVEWLWSFGMLFPYFHGAAQWRNLAIVQLGSVTGVWGLTALVLLVNAALAEAIWRWREGRGIPWGLLGAVAWAWAGVASWGAVRHGRIEAALEAGPALRVAQLQTHLGMVERAEMSSREEFDEWIGLTRRVPKGAADLVVWPEGGCPYAVNEGKAADQLARLAREGGFEMVVGGGSREREPDSAMGEKGRVSIFNSVWFFGRDGAVRGRYDKVVPLPFGEYIPFSETFPILADWIQGPGHFQAGDEAVVVEMEAGRVAAPICYEAILPRLVRSFDAPDLLVNGTNDAWYGDTEGPWQHGQLAALRSVEIGVPMVRSAFTGASFVVEPHGEVHAVTGLFEDVARIVTVRRATVSTVYAWAGDWFVAACALVVALAAGGLRAVSDPPRSGGGPPRDP
jgi:apolipoprotein N-acyltransferase